jgi:hypothetical protein
MATQVKARARKKGDEAGMKIEMPYQGDVVPIRTHRDHPIVLQI